jgi:hypothetical protein
MKPQDFIKKYAEVKSKKERYMPVWRDIAKYTGIMVDPDDAKNEGDDLDSYTLDRTTALAVVQSADYLKGIIIGTGQKGFDILPSDEVLELVDRSAVADWFKYATTNIIKEMNHPDAGFHDAFQSYFYDQVSFGNSGVGTFKNHLKTTSSANALIFREYGVDTMAIDVGKNGVIDTSYNLYEWRTNQFVNEFCYRGGEFDEEMFKRLPREVQDAYLNNDVNKTFKVVQGILPNSEYDPTALGVAGAKYKGYWFLESSKDSVFFEEAFKERPISYGRPVKVRNEIYGRAYGTVLLSSIRALNEIVNGLMITLDKQREPAMGVFGNAILGDGVIDTSSGSITTFDASKLNGNSPIFPIQDVGDPSGIVNFLLPYLNDKISTAFKVDILLDFNADANMTATESLQRYTIRNKSILGLIIQQINDVYIPTIRRVISILMDMGRLGVEADDPMAEEFIKRGIADRIIPEAVAECIREGKPWYKIQFNNEIEKISNTDKIENLLKMLQGLQGLLAFNPELSSAIDWHRLLWDLSAALGFDYAVISEREFRKQMEQQAALQAEQLALAKRTEESVINKNNASAIRNAESGLR